MGSSLVRTEFLRPEKRPVTTVSPLNSRVLNPVRVERLERRFNRRRFLYGSAVFAGAGFIAGPSFLRGKELNEKLNIGMIGLGGKSSDNLKGVGGENIVALCDVDGRSVEKVGIQHPQATRHRDFRKLLEQRDLDAVVVTTPDHIHAVASMMAIKLGKHVYCEKPLTHSVYEARQLRKAESTGQGEVDAT